jgi:hypothetical protein
LKSIFSQFQWCEYVTELGVECAHEAAHVCRRCGIRLCKVCACVNRYDHARERAAQRYCFDCHQILEAAALAGPSKFADVQPVQLDDYEIDTPIARRNGSIVKWD